MQLALVKSIALRVLTAPTFGAVLLLSASATGCARDPSDNAPSVTEMTWEEIIADAEGTTVRLGMWTGDPEINAYVREHLVEPLLAAHGIDLRIVSAQGGDIVSRLTVDRESGRIRGDLDLVWINGETFYQLRRLDALYGPFTGLLPNDRYLDWENPFIHTDFQKPVEGWEMPWGNVQFTLIHNTATVPAPPRTTAALARWIRNHPKRFTVPNDFAGMTFLKSLLYRFAREPEALDGPFDPVVYGQASAALWAYLRPLRPHFWRGGETYPANVNQLHRLFANGEIDFTMSNNDGEVDNKVLQGILPETARAFVPEYGSIRNSHYWGIPFNAPNRPGALVVANLAISPRAQFEKAKPANWGDGTVLAVDKLPPDWRARFAEIPGRTRAPPRAEITDRALREPAPEVMLRLFEDFRSEMIQPSPGSRR
ncbi:MAG: ABC transporter substrate-binding protein [Opitutales bacterium]